MSRVQCPMARTKAKARYSSGTSEVGARAAWPSLRVLPPWFRRWRRPMAQRPGAAAAYEEALLAEPERPHWLWTPSPEPTTPPEPLSTTEKLLRQGNLPDSQANGPSPAGFDTVPALPRRVLLRLGAQALPVLDVENGVNLLPYALETRVPRIPEQQSVVNIQAKDSNQPCSAFLPILAEDKHVRS